MHYTCRLNRKVNHNELELEEVISQFEEKDWISNDLVHTIVHTTLATYKALT